MTLQFTSTKGTQGVPVFQKTYPNVQGGFTLDITGLITGSVLPRGTVMTFDESTRKASPLPTATMQAAASSNAVNYKVKKGHILAVGDYLAAAIGGAAYAITAIDTTNADYDQVTVSTTIGAVAAGVGVFKSSTTGVSVAAVGATPKGLLYNEAIVGVNQEISISWDCVVYARRINAVPASIKSLLPTTIHFSDSF